MDEDDGLLEIELTEKARAYFAELVKFEILKLPQSRMSNSHAPAVVVAGPNTKLLCPIDGVSNPQWTGRTWICNHCGQLYHEACLDYIRKHRPTMHCADPTCPGRSRKVPLLQSIKPLS